MIKYLSRAMPAESRMSRLRGRVLPTGRQAHFPSCGPARSVGHGIRLCLMISASLVLGACAERGVDRPQPPIPVHWANAGGAGAAVTSEMSWWRSFDDPQLDRLIDTALARNNDLAKAAMNVRKAKLVSARTGDPLQAGPRAALITRDEYRLDNGDSQSDSSGLLQLKASYTIGLWGRLALERDMSRWAQEASEADQDNVRLNIIGMTADLYWKLGYFNQRLASAEESLLTAVRTQRLVHAQSVAGAVSALERREAEQTVLTQRSSLSQLRQAQTETRNALALLIDSTPSDDFLAAVVGQEPQALPSGALPAVQEGLPATLLSRRPDLRTAELNLRRSLAQVDIVRTQYYPTLVLTGALGSSSTSLGQVLRNPAAILGADLTLPFMDLKALRLDTKIAQTEYETAVLDFRQVLYQAFVDVENALSARGHLAEQAYLQAQNLVAAREAERLYAIRYRAGAVTLRTWLDAQESRRTAEILLAQARLSQLQNLNTLYQALGGDARSPDAWRDGAR
ncbi:MULTISPECIES: efflux transporter outer membrane subunit [Pseudomonas aeruginosa group]|uniref:efflux transporter outer membrane subunit n=1 Tax=Pseudomonas aeruginosa group TaxID=136841 RepID=UPI000A454951|nr:MULTISPECIES: efflux transporter outer membrane subunit [Pseudomonas aeruginosa group]MDT1025164.1 efflux transporter outer membrane subunit [Pseudomonas paraeruginosa]PHJ29110.1 RND transporter [Pseudomonas paraeruginosa]QQV49744.1 efflux transporter outer membrane subunit [Pseudomonas aeruginosa]RQF81076.1 RND transporter [Pseudomonas aeruginosa]